jgi:polyisoprenoid-binding protein YceI
MVRKLERRSTMTTIQAHRTVPAGSWTSDRTHSSATFEVGHNGVSTFNGKVKDFAATLEVGDGNFDLQGSARVESLDIDEENLRAHLLSPEFFDLERYPEIRFSADEIDDSGERLIVRGDLEIKGNKKRVEATAEVGETLTGLAGKEVVGLDLETVIDRNEFGLTWNADLPGGGKALADDVRLVVHLELAREEG